MNKGIWSAFVVTAGITAALLAGCQAGTGGQQTTGNQQTAGSQNPAGDQQTTDIPSVETGAESEPSKTAEAESETEDLTTAEAKEPSPDYIFPDSDKAILEREAVRKLTPEQIRLARNEIYARHGRGFQLQELQTYFDSKSWYKKTVEPDKFSEGLLNDIEKRNIRYLKGFEPVEGLAGLSDAPSKEVIDRYGYEDGHSQLSFALQPGTIKDSGDYYQVDAVYCQGIEAPGNLKYGDRVTLTFDELTGETKTLEYREGGLYPVDEGQYATQYYYSPTEDGSPVVLYQDSDDRVDKPICEGQLYVRKDATDEIDIVNQSVPITFDKLNGDYTWYNGVFFDKKGYAVRLVSYGD